MKTFIIECNDIEKNSIIEYIKENDGKIEYSSPILPIIGATFRFGLVKKLKHKFNLDSIEIEGEGFLQREDGVLNSFANEIQLIPGLNYRELRKHNKTGWGVKVAVLDSGVAQSWVDEEYDFSGFGNSPYIDHGTKVATIIKTFAPGSRISSYKVCHEYRVKEINVLQAIDTAIANNSDIINISIGFQKPCTSNNLCNLCKVVNYYSLNNNVLFVTSAGNNGKEKSISCPGNAQEAVTVGSVNNQNNSVASYSSKGVPGVIKPNILTTGEIIFRNSGDKGTSFSSPIVAGIFSAFSVDNLSFTHIKNLLYGTADDLGLPEHYQGFGLLNLEKMLEVHQDEKSNNSGKGYEQNQ